MNLQRIHENLEERWLSLLAIAIFGLQTAAFAREFLIELQMYPDSAFFEHAGWYMTQGAVPYRDFWDVKPPAIHETSALVALVSGWDPFVQHVLSVLLTMAAMTVAILLVGILICRITGSPIAGLAAGLAVLAFPMTFLGPVNGLRAKTFSLAFGFLGIYFLLEDKPLKCGGSAALAAGYWQLALIFPLLVLAHFRAERKALVRALGGMAAATALVTAPIILLGGLESMLVEVIVAPLSVSESQPFVGRLANGATWLGYAALLVPAAFVGMWTNREQVTQYWWILVGLLWFTGILFMDLDGRNDLLVWFFFIALGIGVLVSTLSDRHQVAAVAVLILLMVSGPVWMMLSPPPKSLLQDYTQEPEMAGPPTDDMPSIWEIYWQRIEPESCHYRFSSMEVAWIEQTGGDYQKSVCGLTHG